MKKKKKHFLKHDKMNNMVNKCCDSNCYLGQATDLINDKLLILNVNNGHGHGLRTPREEMAFTARPKIQSQSQTLGMAKAYFVCHIGPIFPIAFIYAFIECQ